MEACTGGEKGRQMCLRLTQKIAEGKTSYQVRVKLDSTSDDEKTRKKHATHIIRKMRVIT